MHHVSVKIHIGCVCVSLCSPLTCMCQTESPESEVRGCVGDAAQAVLYGVDRLMYCHIRKVKLWDITRHQIRTLLYVSIKLWKTKYLGPDVHTEGAASLY